MTQEKAVVPLSGRNVLLNHSKRKSRGEGGTLDKPRTQRMPTIVKHSRKNVETKAPGAHGLPHLPRN